MADNIFPEVVARPKGIIFEEERQIYQYPIVMKYLQKKIDGWNVAHFFEKRNIKNVALYAIVEFTDLVIDDWNRSDSQSKIVAISDKNYKKYKAGYKGCQVISVNELIENYKTGKIQMIVVCSIFHENEIFRELMNNGVQQDSLISINSVVFDE